jgi:cytochrome c553
MIAITKAPRSGRGALFLSCLAALSLAGAPLARAYDAEAGRKKAEPCEQCHGPHGNSELPQVPSLAGQQRRYISLALYQFRSGHRASEQMAPFAQPLTDEDLGDIAAYFTAQTPASPSYASDPAKAAAAAQLAKQDHCAQCHGPTLTGQEHVPRLAGQQLDYLRAQLHGFKAATRGDIDGLMTSAAQALSDADIEVLADYLAGLKEP